ncbi:MAG: amino acid adenylation domain-containing protein [Bacteroidota bacterium]
MSFVQQFEKTVEKHGSEVSVAYKNQTFNYDSLNRKANQWARLLRKKFGTVDHKPIGLLVDRNEDMIVFVLAIWKSAAIFVPIDPNLPAESIRHIVSDSNVEIIITDDDRCADRIGFPGAVVNVRLLSQELNNHADANLDIVRRSNDPAYIIYTSGSTGRPKGVLVNYGNLESVTRAWGSAYGIDRTRPVLLQMANIAFDVFVGDLCRALLYGGKLVICPWEDRLNPAAIYKLLVDHQVTLFESTGALIFPLMEYIYDQHLNIEHLRLLIIGSDVCHHHDFNKLLDRYGRQMRIINSYGTTETTIDSSFYEAHVAVSATGVVPVGRPLPGTTFLVLDEKMQMTPVGVRGTLYIGGAGVSEGYINQPELTAEKFIEHKTHGRLYKTGDQVKWQFSGDLEFLGRDDTQIKIRGYRVELGEIENMIGASNQEIEKVCVLVLKDHDREYLCACYQSRHALAEEQLMQHVKTLLPSHMCPERYVHFHALPLSANGKIARNKIVIASGLRSKAPAEIVEPVTALEKTLAEIWCDVLKIKNIGIHDNFFDHGGHSLKAFQIVIRCQQKKIAISHIDIFVNPTIRMLALKLEQAGQEAHQKAITAIEEQHHYPVSPAQRRLWLLHQTDEQSTAYHMPAVFRLKGSLSIKALQAAYNRLISRHESLRAVFAMIQGEVRQRVLSEHEAKFKLKIHSQFAKLSENDIQLEIERRLLEPFDLSAGPLIRMSVWPSAEEYWLTVNMHHIISDEWSAEILIREFVSAYNAAWLDENIRLVKPEIQYKDYVVYLKEILEGEIGGRAEQYWLDQFAHPITPGEIRGDFRRTAEYQGGELQVELGLASALAVKDLCDELKVTPYMVFVSAVATLLHKYSGQETVTVGSLQAGRDHAGLEDQVGFYINTLPLKIEFSKLSFKTHVLNVKSSIIHSLRFGYYPYDDLIDRLDLKGEHGHVGLFNVMVNLKNSIDDERAMNEMRGVQVQQYFLPARQAKTDLIFNFFIDDENIHLSIDYNRSLFREETVRRLVSNLKKILEQVTNNPQIPLPEIEMVGEEERSHILNFNPPSTSVKFSAPLHILFEKEVAASAEKIAVVTETSRLSYDWLNKKANQLAHYLRRHYQIQAGDLVGLSVGRSENILIGILGILKTGAAYLPIDRNYPDHRKLYIIRDSGVRLVLADAATWIDDSCPIILLDDAEIGLCESVNTGVASDLSDLAYVIYTSGSTGDPKGVLIEHRSVLNLIHWLDDDFYMQQPSPVRAMLTASINFDASVQQLFLPLIRGGTLIISSEESKKDPARFVNDMLVNKVNIVDVTPSLLTLLIPEMARVQLIDLKYVLVGGEPITAKTVKDFYEVCTGTQLINVYGPTEATVDSTFCKLENSLNRSVTIGKPLKNVQVHIFNSNKQLVPIGAYGELYIGGACLGRGYLNRPELTHECYVPHPFMPGSKLYKTGDIGRWNAEGELELRGRNDRQVKIRGFRIELGEIENILVQHPDVSEGFVNVQQDADGTASLAAYFHCGQHNLSVSEVRSFLTARVPAHMVPTYFVRLDTIPLTAHGKVDYRLLPRPLEVLSGQQGGVALKTEREIQLMDILKNQLSIEHIADTDNFFDLGGHSLKAMKVASQVQKELGVALEVKHIFEHAIIADLLRLLNTLPKVDVVAIPPIEEQDYYGLSNAQKQLWIANQLADSDLAYVIHGAYEWTGPLNKVLFSKSVAELICRHEILRTYFIDFEGVTAQRIAAFEALDFRVEYLQSSTPDEKNLSDQVSQLCSAPFDLAFAPLLRVSVISVTSRRHILVFQMHHIIGDGWSTEILMRQLVMCYQHQMTDANNRVHYKDYAAWQNSKLASGALRDARKFWLDHLRPGAEGLGPFMLPTTSAGSEKYERGSGLAVHKMSPALSEDFNALSRRLGVSPFMVFLSALYALCYRITGKNEIIIGIPSANRDHANVRDQVGFFVNTIPSKRIVSGETEFRGIVDQVKQHLLSASRYQDYPLNVMIEDLGLQEKHTLFNVIALYVDKQTLNDTGSIIQDVTLKEFDLNTDGVHKFDWQFLFSQQADSITLSVEYNREKIYGDHANCLLRYLNMIIEQIIVKEDVTIGMLDLDDGNDQRVEHSAKVDAFDFDF